MKIIVLGGAGDMAGRSVEDLADTEGVERVTIADRNVDAAHALAARLTGSAAEVDVKRIDADDHAGLVDAVSGYDVAASGLGPFFIYEPKLVRAAIEAGVDYASISDEWESARAVIDGFHDQARERGVTVITGLGTSPGISNIGVRYLVERLDRTRKVQVSVYQPLQAGGGPAVVKHMLHIMSGEISVWREGRRETVPALSEERLIEFPRFGKVRTWNMGHAEPETVPRYVPGVQEVGFYMGFGAGAQVFVTPARWGLFAGTKADLFARLISAIERLTGGEPEIGAVRLDAWGEKDGKDAHLMVCGTGQMREATGLCLSIGAVMLAKKELLVEEGGVYAPEACINPDLFIPRLRAKGIEAYQDLEMTRPLE